MHTCIHTCMHTCTHTQACTQAHTRTHTHTHTRTQTTSTSLTGDGVVQWEERKWPIRMQNCSLVRPLLCAQALSLWQSILDGPLLRILQQDNSSNPVRASACDCVANIGAEVFDLLPVSGDWGVAGSNLIRASTPVTLLLTSELRSLMGKGRGRGLKLGGGGGRNCGTPIRTCSSVTLELMSLISCWLGEGVCFYRQ